MLQDLVCPVRLYLPRLPSLRLKTCILQCFCVIQVRPCQSTGYLLFFFLLFWNFCHCLLALTLIYCQTRNAINCKQIFFGRLPICRLNEGRGQEPCIPPNSLFFHMFQMSKYTRATVHTALASYASADQAFQHPLIVYYIVFITQPVWQSLCS